MRYRYLGKSGLRVSVLTFGAMTFGRDGVLAQIGSGDLSVARRQVDVCLDAGINLFDTADSYGQSEEVLGQVIAGRRDRLLMATKAHSPTGPGPNDSGLSRHHLIRACEASMRRLGVDHIDLYQLHGWDGRTPIEEILRALDDLTRAGKIGYVGISNFAGWHVMKMLATAERERLIRPVAHQLYYSLAAREAEYELLPIAVDQQVGTLVWSPLSGGWLSGKYRRGAPAPEGSRGDPIGWNPWAVRDQDRLYDTVEVLVDIGRERDVSPAAVALAWLLDRPGISSLVVGARTERQLADNLAAVEIAMTREEKDRLEQASAIPALYPYWHQARYASDRLSDADVIPMEVSGRRGLA